MWEHVTDAAPIRSITNGVHPGTWQSPLIREADNDDRLRQARRSLKGELLERIHEQTGVTIDPDWLLIGFARRAAPYKRSDLILRDRERLLKLFAQHPVAIVFSGKSHPQDRGGKAIVKRLALAMRDYPGRIVFLENYDMQVGRAMVRGCDVWLNNPVRPLEASGTSGMKAAMNGALNVSILDGWWPEGCEHGVTGWAIGDVSAGEDQADLDALFEVLEEEVLPAWQDRDRWTRMMRASIRMAVEKFSSDRMVRDYFAHLYDEQSASVPAGGRVGAT
jgi:starch phosphorylase